MTFQCTLNTRLKKIVVVVAKSKQYSPFLEHNCFRLISQSENTAASIKRSVMEDFWLPKVSGATNKGKKGGKNPSGNFQHLVRVL